ncbi:hypothetical protein ACJMK2_022480 [Sinanodonta woodiana]|uniref:C-type lectin domain-containing protein n=1 Tax=Sinanodonta woodiana TaxID=1069815 RepID=A0ABD3TJ75_SINWO
MSSDWTEPCIEDDTSGHCYHLFDTYVTWKNAFQLCQLDGGNLVTIESFKEQKFIEDLIVKRKWHGNTLWIGSEKLHPEEQRAWTNGNKMSYSNWSPDSPDSPLIDENCLEINTDDGTWNDEKCTEQNGYICENSST